MRRAAALMTVFVAVAYLPASATIIDIPDDYPTIQQGIDVSIDGDTVLVAEGQYYERINIYGKNILLTSEFMIDGDTLHIQNTIIDADTLVLGVADTGSVVCFGNGVDSTCVLNGFTVQNGIGTIYWNNLRRGGGIYCEGSDPIISNNIVTNNIAFPGAGINCDNADPIIRNNRIMGNQAGVGGGIFCGGDSEPMIISNIIWGNIANGYGGGGIFCDHATIISTVLYANIAGDFGGGIYCLSLPNTIVTNTILWDNYAEHEGHQIYGSLLITYSDIQGGWDGEGNIDVDPLFRDPENGDFHLMSTDCGDPEDSPCIDAGHPDILDSLLDCSWGLGTILSDMGAYGGGDSMTVGIEDQNIVVPRQFALAQNYPNPFNATTVIHYSLSDPSNVTIDIYDILGRKVATLVQGEQQAGEYRITWQANDQPSGVYFATFTSDANLKTIKMNLLK